jgi:O-antigen/teichoic acid export membrane protein
MSRVWLQRRLPNEDPLIASAYKIVTAFNMLFAAAGTSLVVEGAMAEDRIRAMAERITRRFALIVIPGTIAMIAAAPLILLPFGQDYVRERSSVLRLLACGSVFYAALALYVALARIRRRSLRILMFEAVKLRLLLGGAVALIQSNRPAPETVGVR